MYGTRTGTRDTMAGVTRPDAVTKSSSDVSAMFDEIPHRYDLMNDVLTVGITRLWRIATVRAVAPRKGMRILDLAAGTGTSSAALAEQGAHVVAADFSNGMLDEGRKRQAGNTRIEFVWADATELPFEDNSFDAATISFGLRNVDRPQVALAEMLRVTKPGGRVVICEFSTPAAAIRAPYTWYSRQVLPRVAGLVTGSKQAYEYLNETIEQWPDQPTLARWMREAGFERVAYRNLTAGIAALHRGFVPAKAATAPAHEEQASAKPEAKPAAAKKSAKPAAAKSVPAKQAEKKPAAKAPAKPAAKPTAKPAAKPAAQPATKAKDNG